MPGHKTDPPLRRLHKTQLEITDSFRSVLLYFTEGERREGQLLPQIYVVRRGPHLELNPVFRLHIYSPTISHMSKHCLLYTSDAADE